jgi:hypothetical protein
MAGNCIPLSAGSRFTFIKTFNPIGFFGLPVGGTVFYAKTPISQISPSTALKIIAELFRFVIAFHFNAHRESGRNKNQQQR